MNNDTPLIPSENRSHFIGRRKFRIRHFCHSVLMFALAFFFLDLGLEESREQELFINPHRILCLILFSIFWVGAGVCLIEFITGRPMKGRAYIREIGRNWKKNCVFLPLGVTDLNGNVVILV
jgi:hypothetical protein